jgi:putative DNA primase/helicase
MSHHRIGERYTLRYFNDRWYQYDEKANKYVDKNKTSVAAPLIQWGHARRAKTPDKDDGFILRPVDTTQAWVSNIIGCMASECLVPEVDAPCWVNGVVGPPPKDLIIFKNGTMHVPSYLAGKEFDEYMRASTPDLFSLASLPYNWEPQAQCPTLHTWIDSSLGDDPDKIKLLQEWFGYCMTQDTTQQKLMWMRGVPNGGKGVAISVLNGLVGKEQFTVSEFKNLTDKFEMVDLLGKLVCAFPDFKLPSKGDHASALGVILSLSGDDPVKMRQKFKDSMDNVMPFARITVASNDLPNFPDHSGALKRRLLLLEFERTFAAAPDIGLKAKLNKQLPGIAVWALEGLRRLKATKNFTVPASMVEVIDSWEEDANPIGTFLRETTFVKPDSKLLKSELFAIYRAWCFSMGSMACSQMNFKQRLADFYRQDVPNVSRANNIYFEGIAVTPQARKQYLD